MSTYYVGGTQQFTHSETDTAGFAIPQELGRWSVSNPAVASITQSGLATWLAPGETEVTFVIQSYKRAGSLHAVVHAPVPVSLAATPAAITMLVGDVAKIVLAGLDADSNPITALAIDSVTSSDLAIAELVTLDGFEFLVVGKGEGSATLTIQAGTATATVSVTVGNPTGLTLAAGDARYVNIAGDSMTGDLAVAGDVAATAFHGDGSALTGISAGGTVAADLATEVIAREDADATLTTLVSAEATTRAAADTTLQAHIDAEATARVNADSAEGTARAAADTTLQTNITSEATARGAADTSEASARASADSTLQGNIDAEASTRAAADTTETAARIAADALKAPLASPALSGAPTAPTPAALDNSTKLATTAYTDAAVGVEASARATAITTAVAALVNSAPGTLDTLGEIATALAADESGAAALAATVATKAPLASPALTGTPTVPTAAPATNTTQAASTAYADAAVAVEAAARAGADTTESAARIAADVLLAPLASPALSGTPTVPTAPGGTNTTQAASTAFVHGEVATEATARASADTTEAAARAAADALLAPLASPGFTGHPTGVTESAADASTRLATTAYADAAVNPAFVTLTDGPTVTIATGGARVLNSIVTLGGNRTLAITGAVSGASGVLIVKQDGTGSRTLALPSGSKVVNSGAGAIVLSTAISAVDILSWVYDGTNYWWTFGKAFT